MVVGWLTAAVSPSTVQYGTASGAYTQTATGTVDFYKYSSSCAHERHPPAPARAPRGR